MKKPNLDEQDYILIAATISSSVGVAGLTGNGWWGLICCGGILLLIGLTILLKAKA